MKISLKKTTITISVIFILGLATYALAGRGYGNNMGGYGNGYHMGNGGYHMGGYGNGYHMGGSGYHMGNGYGHMWNQLSEKDRLSMDENIKEFYNKTKDLREDLYKKNFELQKEFYKKDSSKSTALKLQKEISKLQAKFDKFRLEHRIDMQKKFPELYGRR